MTKPPELYVRMNKHADGTPYIAINRASWAWFKVHIHEAHALANQIIDIVEEHENGGTNNGRAIRVLRERT